MSKKHQILIEKKLKNLFDTKNSKRQKNQKHGHCNLRKRS
jgi:hypothetical protein